MFTLNSQVKLADTDAAGILFYANYFRLAHDGYESFLEAIDYSLNYVINESDILILIVHTEADYKQSLRLGVNYTLQIKVDKIGKTSFALNYRFEDSNSQIVAVIKTIHVTVSKGKNKPVKLPEKLRDKLTQYT
ncbi:MAG: acyl-CoA thioesterase [Candidatus Zixiibacteriota bacterium]